MRLLLELDHDVALDHIRDLLSLLLVDDLLHVLHTFLDVQGERLCVHHDLLTATSCAILLIHAPFSLALRAGLLHLHLHEAHVLDNFDSALALALGASFGLATFSTTALALGAVDVPLHIERLRRPSV